MRVGRLVRRHPILTVAVAYGLYRLLRPKAAEAAPQIAPAPLSAISFGASPRQRKNCFLFYCWPDRSEAVATGVGG